VPARLAAASGSGAAQGRRLPRRPPVADATGTTPPTVAASGSGCSSTAAGDSVTSDAASVSMDRDGARAGRSLRHRLRWAKTPCWRTRWGPGNETRAARRWTKSSGSSTGYVALPACGQG